MTTFFTVLFLVCRFLSSLAFTYVTPTQLENEELTGSEYSSRCILQTTFKNICS